MIKVDRSRGHFISLTLERHRFSEGGGGWFLHILSINTLINLTADAPHVIGSGYSWRNSTINKWNSKIFYFPKDFKEEAVLKSMPALSVL